MLTIRNANLNDIPAIMEIERQSFIPQIQEKENVFSKRIEIFSSGFLVFENESGKICGYICSELWDDLGFNENHPAQPELDNLQARLSVGHNIKDVHSAGGKILYISSFALAKELRGKGTGKSLFAESIDYIKKSHDIKKMILLVNEDWGGAQKIYWEYGFKIICHIPGMFYKTRDLFSDGIVMVK